MLRKLKISSLGILVLALSCLSGCVTIYNPATEKRETLLIDTQGEVALGSDMDKQLQNQLKVLRDYSLQQMVQEVGRRVANFSDRQDLAYNFRIVDDTQLNAFAIPGGFIYVNSGLVNIATEDELAGVLAHEIGHIAARHSIKKLQSVLGYQLLISIVLGAGAKETTAKAIDIVFGLVNLGYSRQDELLADRLAVKYARKAKYDPKAMVTFFEKIEKESGGKQGPNLVFLSSHPPIEQRIKNIEDAISNP